MAPDPLLRAILVKRRLSLSTMVSPLRMILGRFVHSCAKLLVTAADFRGQVPMQIGIDRQTSCDIHKRVLFASLRLPTRGLGLKRMSADGEASRDPLSDGAR
jgi:hypothetical protein